MTATGALFGQTRVNNGRHRQRRLRRKLQHKGTKSARRKRLAGQERRFAPDVNHCISKQLVKNAKGTQRGIGSAA